MVMSSGLDYCDSADRVHSNLGVVGSDAWIVTRYQSIFLPDVLYNSHSADPSNLLNVARPGGLTSN